MPPKAKPPAPPARRAAKSQLNLRVTPQTLGILRGLCERRAAEYAARGVELTAARLQSEVVSELLYRAATDVGADV